MNSRRIEKLSVILVSLVFASCLSGRTVEYRLPGGYEGYFAVVPADKGVHYTKDFSDRDVSKRAAINAWQRVVQSKPQPNS